MLSGEGNENGEKTKIGLISKKATLQVQHTFFVHFFAHVLHDYNVKLQKRPGYTFYEGSVVRVLVHFLFSLLLIFTLLAATKFDVVPPTKNVSELFFSLSFTGLLSYFSLFLCLSLSLYSRFVDMTKY